LTLESSKLSSGRKNLNGGSLFANATSCPATGARTSCPSDPYQGSIQNPVSMHGYLYAKPAGALAAASANAAATELMLFQGNISLEEAQANFFVDTLALMPAVLARAISHA